MSTFSQKTIPDRAVGMIESNPQVLMMSLHTILCVLRALHWETHTAHWNAKGEAFYSNHNMFSEMYKETEEDYDSVAEKIVGTFQTELSSFDTIQLSSRWISKVQSIQDPYEKILKLEQILLQLIENCCEICKDFVSHGIENMLDEISDKHEKHVYFLNQSLK